MEDNKQFNLKLKTSVEMFYNEDNMYGIYKCFTSDDVDSKALKKTMFDNTLSECVIVGNMQRLELGLEYQVTVKEEFNKKYNNMQFKAINVTLIKPSSIDDTKRFLNVILTEKQTDTILSVYPNIIDMVINNEEVDVAKLKGIGKKSFEKIKLKIEENYILQDIVSMLSKYDISINVIRKLYAKYKNPTLLKEKILNNPYLLTEVKGLGFKKVDKIALSVNKNLKVSEERVRAYLYYTLNKIGNDEGHSRILLKDLDTQVINDIKDCYNIYLNIVEKEKDTNKQLYIENGFVGLKKNYELEKSILNKLNELENTKCSYNISDYDIDKAFRDFNAEKGYKLTTEQKSVLISGLKDHNVVLLTGKSGTGKSSSLNAVMKVFKNKKVDLCALSAKATRRMEETTGKSASTIHSLLGFEGEGFSYGEDNNLKSDLIILDEASMINSSIFHSLLVAIKNGSKLLIIFDDGQLSPIGVGNIAKDLLESNFYHIELTKVQRQVQESGILMDGNTIREGINPIKKPSKSMIRGNLKDMFYYFSNDREEIFNTAIKYYMKALKNTTLEDLVLLVPRKSNAINSTQAFNIRIQDLLLKSERSYIKRGEKVFKLGAKVIQRSNDNQKGIVNGEVGFVTEISQDSYSVTFSNNKVVEFDVKDMENMELGYAISVHLSQGSEYNTGIIVLDMNSYMLLSKELIYTAITRCKKKCLVVAEPKAFNIGIKKAANKRNTWLQELIK